MSEATIFCVDNSEWMRNGDYSPNRLDAQRETIQNLTTRKLDAHPENLVGLITMAGKRIQVHAAPCKESGKITRSLNRDVKVEGKSNFLAALKTAQLALKKLPIKSTQQRIILFVGSPIDSSVAELEDLGKKFNKAGVAVDVVLFGTECQGSREKLSSFINAVKKSDNSRLCVVPPGPHYLSDMVLPILESGGGGGGGAAAAAAASGGFGGAGIPNDPQSLEDATAVALRVSMEEEYQRQQKLAKERAEQQKNQGAAAPAASSAAPSSGASASGAGVKPVTKPIESKNVQVGDEMEDEEDEDLEAAIALSLQKEETPAKSEKESKNEQAPQKAKAGAEKREDEELLTNPDFLKALLQETPGASNISVENLLNQLGEEDDEEEEDK